MGFETVGQEDEKTRKRGSSLHRIVGGNKEEQEKVGSKNEYFFDNPQNVELYQYRIEKGLEDKRMIQQIDVKLRNFLKEWGLENDIEITPEHIEILDGETLRQKMGWLSNKDFGMDHSRVKQIRGKYDSGMQKISVEEINILEEKLQLAMIIVHEMVHFQAFQSDTVALFSSRHGRKHLDEEEQKVWKRLQRRGGLRIHRTNQRNNPDVNDIQGTTMFSALDEAVTEELTRRFMEQFGMDIPLIKRDFKKFKREAFYKKLLSKILTPNSTLKDGYHYPEERRLLNEIIDGIFEHGKGDYKTRDDVLRLFTNAALNGRLLPLARKIEEVYGRGTFKKLGKIQHLRRIPKIENLKTT